jgi:hypothetical protein
MDRIVRGRPGRFGRETAAWCRRSSSRCERRIVSGHTSRRSLPKVWRGSSVQERGEQCSVSWSEPRSDAPELPLKHSDLVPQRQDLSVLVSVTHREQAKQGEGVGQAEAGQS